MGRRKPQDDSALRALGLQAPRRRGLPFVVGAVVLAGAAFGIWRLQAAPEGPRYRGEPVTRGDLAVTVTATGTLQGLDTVEVGAEISGRIAQVHVNHSERVKAGQVLATLDTEQLDARLQEATAQVQAAEAAVRNAEATAVEARQKATRASGLSEKGLLSRQELEAAAAAAERAEAAVATATAQRTVARASERATRSSSGKAQIRAPIDGVVLSRQVEPGQTVVASLQAPVLFVLAKDLTKMALHVQVDEADVGRVGAGHPARFTVDAYPGRAFDATVKDVRLYPTPATASSSVVTYEAELTVDNGELLLRPGMTATATITTQRLESVLLAPNAALRFTPPSARSGGGSRFWVPGLGRGRPGAGQRKPHDGPVVWMLQGGAPVAVPLEIGATDGKFTEVRQGELQEGTELLVELEARP